MIQNYLLSNCLLDIEYFNEKFKYYNRDEIKLYADTNYNEAALVYRLARPFQDLVGFNLKSHEGDIVVPSLGFFIEVKYLRNTKSSNKNTQYNNAYTWENQFEKDFKWLCKNINEGKKGKCAFILGWFNAVASLSEIMQLGLSKKKKSQGSTPMINKNRTDLLPFLNVPKIDSKTKDITYKYSTNIYSNDRYEPSTITVVGLMNNYVNCLFIGKPTDKFHFAIYY